MKKRRFTESQIAAILKQEEAGVPVAQLTRKHGISVATYHRWKSIYAGARAHEVAVTDMREVQRQLGHTSAKPTEAYLHAGAGAKVTPTE